MSTVIVSKKQTPPDNPGEGFARRDWIWVALAMVCTWLMLTGLHRLFSGQPAQPPSPPLAVESPKEDLPAPEEPPTPTPPQRTFMMHDEAVRATVKDLREHAKECPGAPDVLSEEQIKAIENQGLLIL
ncbi:MAG: hypothetical protein WCI03_10775 [bacterium]